MTRRLFVAAWLEGAARREAADLLDRLRSADPEAPVRWVPPENLHVTLRFLGDVDGNRVDGLVRSLTRFLAGSASFEFRLGGVGTFPPLPALRRGRAARVLWAGVETGGRELAALASRAERAALEAGAVDAIDDRPFRAHVTLGRIRTVRPLAGDPRPRRAEPRGSERWIGLLEEVTFRGRTHSFEEVTLAESRRTPRGAIYETVARFPLVSDGPPSQPLPEEGDIA